MAEVRYKLGDTFVQPPVNHPGLELELNFDSDDPDAIQISTTNDWDFEKQSSEAINAHIAAGMNGGPGIFEGIPWKVYVDDEVIIDQYIDTADSDATFECDRVSITSREKGGIDWLNDRANNVMYNILLGKPEAEGGISTDDYVQIPYVISSVPNYQATAIAILTGYAVLNTMNDIGREIRKILGGMLSVIGAIGAIINAFVVIVWVILTLVVVIELIINIKDTLIQRIKYHAGMRWQTLLQQGAKAIGKEFKSTLFNDPLYRDTIIIPAKFETLKDLKRPEKRGFEIPSTESNGYYADTYRELLSVSKDIINGKLIVIDNELHLERRDTNASSATYKLPDVELRQHRTNAGEFISNYEVQFRDDLSDENTIDQYEGTISQAITQPVLVRNSDMVLMKGIKTVDIPFALVKRKENLTPIEQRLDNLFKEHTQTVNDLVIVINKVVKLRNNFVKKIKKIIKKLEVIGINIPFSPMPLPKVQPVTPQTIEKRIGMMLLSTDYFQVPKIGSFDISTNPRSTKVKTNNKADWSSDKLYRDFHFINSFVAQPGNEKGNQWLRYETRIPFCKEDFLKVKNNNLIFDAQGRVGKIETLRWNPHTRVADISFRINETYTRNLREQLITPNGF